MKILFGIKRISLRPETGNVDAEWMEKYQVASERWVGLKDLPTFKNYKLHSWNNFAN